ncbi:MAG: thermonuclease family protein [Magnetococcus sp. YQC-9]
MPDLALANDWQGRVLQVTDGDTLVVEHNGQKEKLRVAEIDAPEHGQPFFEEAKAYATRLLDKQMVWIHEKERDRYGRMVGWVSRKGLEDFGAEMVRSGLAWRHIHYSKSASLARLEKEARQRKVGLWSQPDPTPPWVWKHEHRKRGGHAKE